MNAKADGQDFRSFQRALVLTGGALAHQTATYLKRVLAESEGPLEGIGVLPVAGREAGPALADALRQISQVSVKESLVQRGWQMDRLEEVALYLILDLSDKSETVDSAGVIETANKVAQQHFGLSVAVLGIALLPESGEEGRSSLAALTAGRSLFDRGLLVLGTTNTMGLCLPDTDALAQQAARILEVLMTTPLRDAPEWLAEQQGAGWDSLPMVASAGLAVWPWSPVEELDILQRYWLKSVVEAWLADAPEEKGGVYSEKWLATAALEVDQLGQRLSGGREQRLLRSVGMRPQLWRVHETYHALYLLPQQLPQQLYDELVAAQESVVNEVCASLQTTAEEMLTGAPVAGLARLQAFLRRLELFLDDRQERAGIQRETVAERQQAVAGGHRRLASEMERYLLQWPQPNLACWLPLLLRPWRWARLAWHYYQMVGLADQLVQLENEWRQWQWQQLVAEKSESAYQSFLKQVSRIEAQTEEVIAMLHSVQEGIVAAEPGPSTMWGDYAVRRLASLVEKPELEAAWAARMMGGLGRQLTALDDSCVERLSEHGRRLLAEKGRLSAVEALLHLYPTEEALRSWWNQLWEGAAPLRRCGEQRQGECIPTRHSALSIVCSADALRLQQLLSWIDFPHTRWVVSPNSGVTVLRLKRLREGE
jgi:hypothetical protein